MTGDERLDRVLGELNNFFSAASAGNDHRLKVEKVLTEILVFAEDAWPVLDIHYVALRIAGFAFSPEPIDSARMVREIALLAHFMLRIQETEALEWEPKTLVALRKIRSSVPRLLTPPDPDLPL